MRQVLPKPVHDNAELCFCRISRSPLSRVSVAVAALAYFDHLGQER
jgi:hypothetical protein